MNCGRSDWKDLYIFVVDYTRRNGYDTRDGPDLDPSPEMTDKAKKQKKKRGGWTIRSNWRAFPTIQRKRGEKNCNAQCIEIFFFFFYKVMKIFYAGERKKNVDRDFPPDYFVISSINFVGGKKKRKLVDFTNEKLNNLREK